MKNSKGDEISYEYDKVGNYNYDKVGNLTSVSMPASEGQTDRLVTTFDYFDNGANKSVIDPKPQVYTYQYQATGKLAQKNMPNGNTISYSYYLDDALRQMETKKGDGTSIQKHVLEYNENGDQTKDTYTGLDADNKPINNTFTYQYDPRDRLVSYDKSGDKPSQ